MKTSAKHFGLVVWALGQATWAKMTLKLLYLWRHSQKTRTPQAKIFFSSAIYYTGRSVWAIEQLSSAIGGGTRALVKQPKTAGFFCENRQNHPDAKVLYLLAQKYGLQYQTILNFQPPLPFNGNLRNTSYMKKIPNYEL